MKPSRTIAVLLAGAALLGGCSQADSGDDTPPPVQLKQIAGTDRFEVTLSQQAQERLGIATAPVRQDGSSTTVPYAAVIYDSAGATWAYVPATAPRTYLRRHITVASVDGETAVLSQGPAAGTPVVVVGSAELLGAEAQIAGEE